MLSSSASSTHHYQPDFLRQMCAHLRKQVAAAHKGLMSHVNVMGYVAALAAYRDRIGA